MKGRVRLAYGPHAVELDLAEGAAEAGEFLEAYLTPYFAVEPAGAGPVVARVRVEVSPPPPDAPDFAEAPVAPVDRSGGFLRCDGATVERGGIRWVQLRPHGAVVRVDRSRGDITLWSATPEGAKVPALRVVEDVVLNEVQRGGGVVLHASAVVAPEGAVLAVGNKGSGKTSLLCEAMHGFAVSKLANDNVCLMPGPGHRVVARGWPAFFKVGLATVASFPELAADFPVRERDALASDDALWQVYEKVALYPGQGAERFGAPLAAEADLAALVFIRYHAGAPPGLRRAEPGGLPDRLRPFLQGIGNPSHAEWLGLNPVDPAQVETSLAALLGGPPAGVAVYEISWAPSLEALLARIPELRPLKKALRACAAAVPPRDAWPPLPGPAA